jgi:hypothetical protein
MAERVTLTCREFSLLIPANPYAVYPVAERLNYISIETASGEQVVVNIGPTRISASLAFKCVSYNFTQEYEEFLLKKMELGVHPITISCPDYFDLGLGKGVSVSNARYNGPPNLSGVIKPSGSNGLFYDIELPYMFVREP